MAIPLIPSSTNPVVSPADGRGDRAAVDFFLGPSLFALPVAIAAGANAETAQLYVRGYNTFQVWLGTTGAGQFSLAYGICHPREPWPVVAYRTVVGPVATAPSSLVTFGAFGQSAVAFQGDLYTILTLRISASGGTVNLAGLVFWCGAR